MFELHVTNTDATGGTIPISWCVSKDLLEELVKAEVPNPYVVICVAPVNNYDISKEHRQIVPLKDLMAYVQLHCVGENRIWAFVSYQSKKTIQTFFMERWAGYFDSHILNATGDDWSDRMKAYPTMIAPPIVVDVPAECFAPPPSEAMKEWVNFIWRNKPIDQCDFRRRALFAFTLQFPMMMLLMLPRLAAIMVALLIADSNLWGVIKVACQPMTYSDLGLPWKELEGSVFVRYWATEIQEQDEITGPISMFSFLLKKVGWCVFMPVVLLMLLALALGHKLVIATTIVFMFVALLMAIGGIAALVSAGGFTTLFIWLEKVLGLSNDYWYVDPHEELSIVCNGDAKPTNVNALPKNHRTLKLRFQQLKSQMCKPFSR